MNEYLGGVWCWKNIGIWYKKILQRSRDIRYKYPRFFQSLAENGDIVSKYTLLQLKHHSCGMLIQ